MTANLSADTAMVLDTELHFPDQMGVGDIVVIDGEIPCVVCGEQMDQGSVDRGELLAVTGRGEKPRVYGAHVWHFFKTNPATGETERQLSYYLHMTALAKAYGEGEGLKEERPVM